MESMSQAKPVLLRSSSFVSKGINRRNSESNHWNFRTCIWVFHVKKIGVKACINYLGNLLMLSMFLGKRVWLFFSTYCRHGSSRHLQYGPKSFLFAPEGIAAVVIYGLVLLLLPGSILYVHACHPRGALPALGLQDVQWAVGNSRGARKLVRTPHVN
jgi:hypothetical protein